MKQLNEIAKIKVGNIETWEPYYYQSMVGGILVRGCLTRQKKSGKNKGKLMYLTKEKDMTVVISSDELKVND
jgi:hypothetical protein